MPGKRNESELEFPIIPKKIVLSDPDALGEYTGVKPDEFLTIDKKHMEQSGMIYSDHMGTITTMGRGNTASTLNKNGSISNRPDIDPSAGYANGAIDYETGKTENQ